MRNGLDINGHSHSVIAPYNDGIKKLLPKNAPTKSSAIDDVIAAGRKYMKQGRFRMLAAGTVVSGVLGEAVAAQAKILQVATDSGYYRRAVRELQNGNLDKRKSLLIGDDQSLYAEILDKVGPHAAIHYKRAMEKYLMKRRSKITNKDDFSQDAKRWLCGHL